MNPQQSRLEMRRGRRPAWILLVLVAVSGWSNQTVSADILAADAFDYVDGQTLYGQSGGIGWGDIWTGSGMTTDGGRAVAAPIWNPPLYGSRSWANPVSGEWLFVRVELTTPSLGLNDYALVATGTGVNLSQIGFGKRPGSLEFEVGNGGWSSSGLTVGSHTTYVLVGAYRIQAALPDTLWLWVNPDATDYLDMAQMTHSADISRLDFVSEHAGHVGIYANVPGTAFDNLVIGRFPGDVGLRSSAIPEAGPVGLYCGVAGILSRRRGRGRKREPLRS